MRFSARSLVFGALTAGALATLSACADGDDGANSPTAGSAGTATAGSGGTGGGGTANGGNAGEPPATPNVYEADDPGLQYQGRIDVSDPKRPRFSAPGASVRARFQGTAVTVSFVDEHRWGRRNYFDVIVDPGTPEERRQKLTPQPGTSEYPAVWGLPDGEHTVVFVKRTESSIGYVDFLGFSFDGALLEPPPVPTRRVQVIGDSISCGVGNDVPPADQRPPGVTYEQACAEDVWGVPYHNAYRAFGSLTAQHFDAELQVTAVSGIGLVRNYSSNPADDRRTLPEVYDSLFLEREDSPRWDPKDFVPDVVLIALGTNDFSPGDSPSSDPRDELDPEEYAETYVEFIDKLLSDDYYPDAHVFVLGSPMLGNGYPTAEATLRDDHIAALDAVEAHYADEGVDHVHKLSISRTFGQGCSSHPGAAEHRTIATDEVIPAVAEVMGW